jgi:hypothetical protein
LGISVLAKTPLYSPACLFQFVLFFGKAKPQHIFAIFGIGIKGSPCDRTHSGFFNQCSAGFLIVGKAGAVPQWFKACKNIISTFRLGNVEASVFEGSA